MSDSEPSGGKGGLYRPVVVEPMEFQRSEGETSALRFAATVLGHRWKVVGLATLGMLAGLFLAFMRGDAYESAASLMPQDRSTRGQLSQFSGLAAEFGMRVPLGGSGESPAFYADLAMSRAVLERVAISTVGDSAVPGALSQNYGGRARILEVLDASGENERERRAAAVHALHGHLRSDVNRETGVVSLASRFSDPRLAKLVLDRVIAELNRFNLEQRRSQAAEEVAFVEDRLEQAQSELLAAEERLENFLQRNRSYENSPSLVFEYSRLQRRVSFREQVVSTLNRALEEARIEKVQSTPVITVVQPPYVPTKPEPDRGLLWAFVGMSVGTLFGLGWAYGDEMLQQARSENADAYFRMREAWLDTRADLRQIWVRFKRAGK